MREAHIKHDGEHFQIIIFDNAVRIEQYEVDSVCHHYGPYVKTQM